MVIATLLSFPPSHLKYTRSLLQFCSYFCFLQTIFLQVLEAALFPPYKAFPFAVIMVLKQ